MPTSATFFSPLPFLLLSVAQQAPGLFKLPNGRPNQAPRRHLSYYTALGRRGRSDFAGACLRLLRLKQELEVCLSNKHYST